jgi:Matrixin/Carboxypeptidase regulatory-like domain
MKRRIIAVLAAFVIAGSPAPVHAYLKLGARVAGRTVTLQWVSFPVRYFVTERSAGPVTAAQLQQSIGRAFASWQAIETAEISSQFVGFTSANPVRDDGRTTLGFVNRPDLDRVLGATSFTLDQVTGEVVESDIFFNSFFDWSVAAAGELNRFDVESIAVHEIGHLLGLAHSALGETEVRPGGRRVLGAEAVMFPVAFSAGTIVGREIKEDDIAGISDIYPAGGFLQTTGSVSGRVTKSGRGVVGAHVIAFNPRTGKLVAGFSLSDDGSFTIAGLEPGPHVLRVEPLDDGDLDGFFEATLGVDVNFRVKFYERLVVVPRGGGTRNADIVVQPK